ncbi:MAG: aminotransferase class III-fold pyridoxal phosphate-dependent enzyme, partial [Actinomycetota bacterium]
MSTGAGLSTWHPFTQPDVDPAPLRISLAEGTYLYTEEGTRIIDAISSWWVNLHGHCHPHIADAIAGQV